MASLNDIFNAINENNATLNTIANEIVTETNAINAVKTSIDNVGTKVDAVKGSVDQAVLGINTLVTLQNYADQALNQLAQQANTIICILEYISKNTCSLLNEAHMQTDLQKSIQLSNYTLLELFKLSHPGASVEWEALQKLRRDIDRCCPPKAPELPCQYRPCPAPEPLGPPPDIRGGSTRTQ
ncbi:MAG: hypothetical protein JO108_04940 [Acidobacteriaceae bacterium]|nr:hypothetical protein [Acidobacteriaceae bacterium]